MILDIEKAARLRTIDRADGPLTVEVGSEDPDPRRGDADVMIAG